MLNPRIPVIVALAACACATPRAADTAGPAPAPPTERPLAAASVSAASVSQTPAPVPSPAPAPRPTQLALGENHACLTYADGGVACWGENRSNCVGAGSKLDWIPNPTRVPGVEKATQVMVGYDHSCAVLRDGRLQCWGAAHHLVGDDPDPTDKPVVAAKLAGITQLSGTTGELVALSGDGGVRMWESMTSRLYFMGPGMKAPKSFCDGCELRGLTKPTFIASGFNTHCAVLGGGALGCWGGNEYGQHGTGTAEPMAEGSLPTRTPKQVKGIANATDVAVSSHACARLADGHVACWGKNDHGQVGDGSTKNRTVPVTLAGLDQVTGVAVAADSSCALRADGTVQCWGANDEGQLGDGTTTDRLTPTPVHGVSGAVALALGTWRACVIRADGEVWCWGWWDFSRKTPKERDDASRRPQRVSW